MSKQLISKSDKTDAPLNKNYLIPILGYILIWKKPLISIPCVLLLHIMFWSTIYFQINRIFIYTTIASIFVLYDLRKRWLSSYLDKLIIKYNWLSDVNLALQNKEIWSVDELSSHISSIFSKFGYIICACIKKRQTYPTAFLAFCILIGLLLIWLGWKIEERFLFYICLNLLLIIPPVRHYKLISIIWAIVEPIFQEMEAEFDKVQVESVNDRVTDERKFWEPMANMHSSGKHFDDPSNMQFDWTDSESTSESNFIREFLPNRLYQSMLKNKKTINSLTQSMLIDNPTESEIEDWFSEVPADPQFPQQSNHKKINQIEHFDIDTQTTAIDNVRQTSSPTNEHDVSEMDFNEQDIDGFVHVETDSRCC